MSTSINATEVSTSKKGRKVTIVTQQLMQNRIRRANILRANLNELKELVNDPSTSDRVKKILNASAADTFEVLQKSERKVCVAVQKMLAEDFDAACMMFEQFSTMWPNDPSVTIITDSLPGDDDDDDSDEDN